MVVLFIVHTYIQKKKHLSIAMLSPPDSPRPNEKGREKKNETDTEQDFGGNFFFFRKGRKEKAR